LVVSRLEDNLGVTSYYASGVTLDSAVQVVRAKSITPVWRARSTAVRPTVRIQAATNGLQFTVNIYSISCKKQTSPRTTRNAGSVPTISVAPTAPTGTLTVGSVLTANAGTWTNNSGSVIMTTQYRWYRNAVFISSSLGTSSTYTLVAGDSGTTITCGITTCNAAGRSAESISPGVVIA
jgi:hypothetical protein